MKARRGAPKLGRVCAASWRIMVQWEEGEGTPGGGCSCWSKGDRCASRRVEVEGKLGGGARAPAGVKVKAGGGKLERELLAAKERSFECECEEERE